MHENTVLYCTVLYCTVLYKSAVLSLAAGASSSPQQSARNLLFLLALLTSPGPGPGNWMASSFFWSAPSTLSRPAAASSFRPLTSRPSLVALSSAWVPAASAASSCCLSLERCVGYHVPAAAYCYLHRNVSVYQNIFSSKNIIF